MKPILLASTAALAFFGTACAVTAADDHTVRVAAGDGHQSIHINTSGSDSVIIVDGQRIEVRDGAVFIDGERRDAEDGRIVVANGTTIRIGDGDTHQFHWDGDMDVADMARVEADVARAMAMVERIDHGAMRDAHEEARRAIEEAMAGLDIESADGTRWVIEDGERRELTDEERAEVREAIRAAREELRDSMREMRDELRSTRDDARLQRVEILRSAREAGHHGEIAARHAERAQALRRRIHESGARNVRLENENGEQRVWVDDRELEGDERTEWLNRMQLDELDGGPGEQDHSYFFSGDGDAQERRVMVFRESGDGESAEVRTSRQIVIEVDTDDENGVQVYEFSSDDDED